MDPSKKNLHFNNVSGFTLIEVLIAIVLLAFISLYTYKMIDTNIDTKDKVLKEDQLLLQTLTAVSRIDSDLSQIYSPLYSNSKAPPGDTVSSKEHFDGKAKNGIIIPKFYSEDKSSLIFFTSSNRRKISDSKDSRYNWVKYSMRKTDNSHTDKDERNLNIIGENELVRQTIATDIYSNTFDWNAVKSQVLLTQVKSIEYSFWDARAKKFTTSIQDLNENQNIERAVKLKMVWVDEDNHEQNIEKIFRVLPPNFNTKADDLKTGGAYGGGAAPPGVPNPGDLTNPGGLDEPNF